MAEIRFPVGSPLIVPAESPKGRTSVDNKVSTPSFDSVLSGEMGKNDIKLSAHAQNRLNERGLDLTGGDISKIREAMDNLAYKGGRDSLLLMGNTALIVNVPNRTIVTVMDTGNIFTNIDSAAVI